jgi:addiction module HigA family antidote
MEDTDMSDMFNPPHPGRVLKNTVCRDDGGISVTEFANLLKVSRVALSRVLNCRAAISAELAIRLEAALGTSAQTWVGMQSAYDLWQARKKRHPKIQRMAA